MGVRISKVGGRNMRLGSALCAGIVVVACFLFAGQAKAVEYSFPAYDPDTGGIVTQTWTKEKSPYLLLACSGGIIPVGVTLTIEPGVTVVYGPREHCNHGETWSAGFWVQGTLVAHGTDSEPIRFVSWADPQYGDVSGYAYFAVADDGPYSGSISTYGESNIVPRVSLSHVNMVQNEVALLFNSTQVNAELEYLDIQDSGNAGIATRATITVHHSKFFRNPVAIDANVTNWYGEWSPTTVDARDNWWGDDTGPTIASNPDGRGDPINGDVQYDPWTGKTTRRNPVILIPGILGTEMKKGGDLLWMDLKRMAGDVGDQFLDPLQMNADGTPSDSEVVMGDVLRNKEYILGTYHYFDLLVTELKKRGYTEDEDIFVFPYDWRLSNKVNSQELKEKIDNVIAQTRSQKVDLVAHSMGGLVAKQYIIDNGSNTVDKLIFIGTPQLGAPKAFKALLVGDTFGVPLVLNQGEMKKLAQNMSSVYELLPTQEYVRRFGGFFYNLAPEPADYAKGKAYLLVRNANESLLHQAEQFHSQPMSAFVAPNVSIYNIMGCNTPTVGRIIRRNAYLEGGVVAEDYDLEETAGDGTVPLTSAGAISAEKRFFVSDADHGKMPSQDGVRQLVASIVTNSVDKEPLPNGVFASVDNCHMKNGKLISVHSPVDLHVYDADGHHVGVALDGSVDVDIPGANYEDVGHNKFIFVPTDNGQEYRVALDATATGTFSFRVSSLQDGQKIQTVLYNKIAIIPASTAMITVTGTSADTQLQFDKTGSGAPEVLNPSAVLDWVQVEDFEKPSTAVQFDGVEGLSGWYRSVVTTTFLAFDSGAGILKTEYSVDGGNTWSVYTEPVELNAEGTATLWYRSVDRAGNVEDAHSVDVKIDTVAPEATIIFDQNSKDVLVKSVSSTTDVIIDTGDVVTVSDQAGNTLVLRFFEKDRKKSVSAELKSLEYNGQELQRLNRNRFGFYWEFDRKGVLQELKQSIFVKDDFRLSSEYTKKRNVTLIKGKDVDRKKIKEKLPGLVLFKIQTNSGSLDYFY